MRDPLARWAPASLPVYPSRREIREYRQEEIGLKHEIRWIWYEFCAGLDLTLGIIPAGFGTREPPRVGKIILGPPTRLRVELRPGQVSGDLLAVRVELAAAYSVDDIDVRTLANRWAEVELVEYGTDQTDEDAASVDSPGAVGMTRRDTRSPHRHFPRRGRRAGVAVGQTERQGIAVEQAAQQLTANPRSRLSPRGRPLEEEDTEPIDELLVDVSAALKLDAGLTDLRQSLTLPEGLSEVKGTLNLEHGVRAALAAVAEPRAAESTEPPTNNEAQRERQENADGNSSSDPDDQ